MANPEAGSAASQSLDMSAAIGGRRVWMAAAAPS